MLYKDIRRAVLSHIDQYTMAGAEIMPTYNDQADYLNRIPILINEGLVNILTLTKPRPVVVALSGGKTIGDQTEFALPADFWTLSSGGVFTVKDGQLRSTNRYRLLGQRGLLVPTAAAENIYIEYNRYPHLLPVDDTITDDYEVEEDIDVIHAAILYAAAQLLMREDAFSYSALQNQYESQVARLSVGVTAEVGPIKDAYAGSVSEGDAQWAM